MRMAVIISDYLRGYSCINYHIKTGESIMVV
jgi:hypothetical protein